MRTLALGARGHEVEYLRRLLGDAGFVSSSGCSADLFDESVERAVRAFQQARRGLAPDGVVAPSTWLALGVRVWREHAIRLVPQVSDDTCWSAAASMVNGSSASIGPGQARLGLHDSGLRPGAENLQAFARSMGWRVPAHTPGAMEVVHLLQRQPLWLGLSHAHGWHALVLSGVYSDGAQARRTMVRIHDPSPVGRGSIYPSFLDRIEGRSGTRRIPTTLQYLLVPS